MRNVIGPIRLASAGTANAEGNVRKRRGTAAIGAMVGAAFVAILLCAGETVSAPVRIRT
jgi:hypothetical protein